MADSTSVRTPTPPGNPPGSVGAFVFLLTVLANFLFIGFVLVKGYPVWIGLVSMSASCVISAVVLRHLYTGQTLAQGKGPRRFVAFLGKVLVTAVAQVLKENAQPTVVPGAVDAPARPVLPPTVTVDAEDTMAEPEETGQDGGAAEGTV